MPLMNLICFIWRYKTVYHSLVNIQLSAFWKLIRRQMLQKMCYEWQTTFLYLMYIYMVHWVVVSFYHFKCMSCLVHISEWYAFNSVPADVSCSSSPGLLGDIVARDITQNILSGLIWYCCAPRVYRYHCVIDPETCIRVNAGDSSKIVPGWMETDDVQGQRFGSVGMNNCGIMGRPRNSYYYYLVLGWFATHLLWNQFTRA